MKKFHLTAAAFLLSFASIILPVVADESPLQLLRKTPESARRVFSEEWFLVTMLGTPTAYMHVTRSSSPEVSREEAVYLRLESATRVARFGAMTEVSFTAEGIVLDNDTVHDVKGVAKMAEQTMTFTGGMKGDSFFVTIGEGPLAQEMEFPVQDILFTADDAFEDGTFTEMAVNETKVIGDGETGETTLTYLGEMRLPDDSEADVDRNKSFHVVKMQGPMEIMPSTRWVRWDDDTSTVTIIREETSTMGLQSVVELVSEATAKRFIDMETPDLPDIFTDVIDTLDVDLPPLWKVQTVRFSINLPSGSGISSFPETSDRQRVRKGEDGNWIVDVQRKQVPEEYAMKRLERQLRKGEGAEIAEKYLSQDIFVQPNDPDIQALAQSLAKDETDAVAIVEEMAAWVYENIEATMDVSLATAAETLQTRRGDCTEYSVLLASLLRARGIPARVIEGVVHADIDEPRLIGHMWCEVYLDDWYPVDGTRGSTDLHPVYVMLDRFEGSDVDVREAFRQRAKRLSLLGSGAIQITAWTEREL